MIEHNDHSRSRLHEMMSTDALTEHLRSRNVSEKILSLIKINGYNGRDIIESGGGEIFVKEAFDQQQLKENGVTRVHLRSLSRVLTQEEEEEEGGRTKENNANNNNNNILAMSQQLPQQQYQEQGPGQEFNDFYFLSTIIGDHTSVTPELKLSVFKKLSCASEFFFLTFDRLKKFLTNTSDITAVLLVQERLRSENWHLVFDGLNVPFDMARILLKEPAPDPNEKELLRCFLEHPSKYNDLELVRPRCSNSILCYLRFVKRFAFAAVHIDRHFFYAPFMYLMKENLVTTPEISTSFVAALWWVTADSAVPKRFKSPAFKDKFTDLVKHFVEADALNWVPTILSRLQ